MKPKTHVVCDIKHHLARDRKNKVQGRSRSLVYFSSHVHRKMEIFLKKHSDFLSNCLYNIKLGKPWGRSTVIQGDLGIIVKVRGHMVNVSSRKNWRDIILWKSIKTSKLWQILLFRVQLSMLFFMCGAIRNNVNVRVGLWIR